jgi:integrase/recombinase XerD
MADLDRERLTVLERRGKGNKDRFVPLGARALCWIDKYLRDARPQRVQDVVTSTIFVTRAGSALHPNQLSIQVRRYLNRAGIDKPGSCH